MRYNHFSTLPERGFQKRLGGRMPATLEGGGGGVISSIGNAISGAVSGIGHAVEGVGKSISDVGVGIDKSVRKAVPGGWVTVGALAATIATAGAASGAFAAAEGAAAAGEAAAVGEGVAAGAGAAEASTAAGADVFGGLAGTAGETTAAGAEAATAAAGSEAAAANAALDPLSWDAAAKAAMQGAGKGALMGGISSAAQGRDPLTGALMGAATGGMGAGAGNIAGQFGAGAIGSGVAGGLTGSGTGSLLSGKGNVGNAALIGGITGGITSGIGALTDSKALGSATSPFVKSLVAQEINGTPSPTQRSASTAHPITSSSSLLQNPATMGAAASSSLLPSFSSPYLSSEDPSQNTVESTYDKGLLKADLGTGNQDYFITPNYKNTESILPHFAAGQKVGSTQTNVPTSTNELLADLGKSTPSFTLIEKPYSPSTIKTYAEGGGLSTVDDCGIMSDHNPEFYSQGGLENTYVKGDGDGTSDSVPAMLADGEYVLSADIVSALGNGSNDAGAKILNEFMQTIREHKQKHDPKQLPADSKGPLAYLLQAKKKVGGSV